MRLHLSLDRPLPRPVQTATYFLVSEAVTNAVKHSGAGRVDVTVTRHDGGVSVLVADDGTGRPDVLRRALAVAEAGDVDGQHRGLANMATRARELGGTFEVRRARLGGIRVVATVPLAEQGAP